MNRININLTAPWMIILAVALAVLKSAKVIDWSWWLVFAPIWTPFAFLALILLLTMLVGLFNIAWEKWHRRKAFKRMMRG